MKIMARISQKIHPAMFNCINGGEFVVREFVRIILLENGYDFKIYLFNFVYNFGHIFDAFRDVYLFFAEDPRGRIDSVSRAGYSLGQALYFFITPDIAEYESQAEEYEMQSDIFNGDRLNDLTEDIENFLNGN